MTENTTKNRRLAEITPTDEFSGWTYTLYADGRVAATHNTRWQGMLNGARWLHDNAVDIDEIDEDDEDNDAEAMLTAFCESAEPSHDDGWRQVRRGNLVR